jgi:hypothetical protein
VQLRPDPVDADGAGVVEQGPTYLELAERYNARVAELENLWSRASVKLSWREVDEDGEARTRSEDADGTLMVKQRDRCALAITKVGRTIFYAGSNSDRYWLFALGDERVVYTGRHEASAPRAMADLPVPVRPRDLPILLGLTPIDTTAADRAPAPEQLGEQFLIEPPGMHVRMLLTGEGRPVRVDLMDERGWSAVACTLTDFEPVKLYGEPEHLWPEVATHVDIFLLRREGRLTLWLHDMTDGDDGQRLADKAFDFDQLLEVYRPDEVVLLDEPASP